MMTINIVCVGHLKEKFWKDACQEYCKRLSRFCKLNILEVDDCDGETIEKILSKEAEFIEKRLTGDDFLLAIEGQQLSSEQFAKLILNQQSFSSQMTFVIGSSYGVSERIKQKVPNKISFGKLTYPHNLARVILLEQIYRAFMINSGSTYHK